MLSAQQQLPLKAKTGLICLSNCVHVHKTLKMNGEANFRICALLGAIQQKYTSCCLFPENGWVPKGKYNVLNSKREKHGCIKVGCFFYILRHWKCCLCLPAVISSQQFVLGSFACWLLVLSSAAMLHLKVIFAASE